MTKSKHHLFKSHHRQRWLPLLLLCFLTTTAFSQEKYTLSGYLRDTQSGEELIGATIFIKELGSGTVTNVYGFYSITLPKGTYTVEYTYIGYQRITETIELTQDITKSMEIGVNTEVLKEVVVSAEREDKNVTDVQMSVEKLSMETIQKIPQLLGEADVIKSIQLRPGVTSVGEGAAGFNVRGGNIDQNLILLDEAPIYNSSHLFGFFSTFNPDAIKDAQLYKGGIPARYGGRLSSVLDVRQREGNNKEFHARGGLGLLFSRVTLGGPIVKDKVSFLVSGRRSYADVFLKLDEELADNTAFFYDLNAKINYKMNDRNRFFLSSYFGRDVFRFGEDFETFWGNFSLSARWNHLFSDKVFSNFTAFYSNYSYQLGVPEGANAFEWTSSIRNYNFKTDFTWYANPNNTIEFGVNGLLYEFRPGRAEGIGDQSFFNVIEVPREHALEPAIYVSNEQKVGPRVTLKYGLRYSHFFNMGETTVNEYRYGRPTREEDIIGTTEYDSWESIADYGGLEPRFAINYLINDQQSVKGSYMRTRQYIHLVSNTTAATPIDVWKPAGRYVDPATADQIAVGYFRNFKGNTYEFSSEVYYKWMDNLLDYKNGADLLLNDNVETEFLSGRGRSYGLELMVKKAKGRFTGWVSYTLSRTEQKVEGYVVGDYFESENGINQGEWYSSNWDKTHDVSVVANFEISEKWEVAGNFIFQTGRPITYPLGSYVWDDKSIPSFRNRNNERVPTYHRLDMSVIYNPVGNKTRRWQSQWVFGVYNLYGRRNPYSIFFRQNEDDRTRNEAVRLAIVGIPVPSVTYNFKF